MLDASPLSKHSPAVFQLVEYQDGTTIMNRLRTFLRRFLKIEDGPTAVEYAVMLALIIVVCIAAVHRLGRTSRHDYRAAASAMQAGS
jgi:pilus assembly protein Flp/PilA